VIARVLLVDDDEHLRTSTARALARAGFDVTIAEEAAPAMGLARTFDVVIADFCMKTATGADVVRHFKRRFGARVYCAILSGNDDDDTRAVCLDAGADAVIVKPASPIELRRRLTEAAAALRSAG
jgi:two-component system, cell cycle response regulator CpdR